jgi:outer membrane protein assembly factor BamB
MMLRGAFLVALVAAACGPGSPPASAPAPPAQATVPKPPDWPTYHGGFSLDGLADAAPSDEPVRLWKYSAEGKVDATPVVGDGRIYATSDKGEVFALGMDGKELWKTKIDPDTFTAPPLYTDQVVIVGTRSGVLRAFDAATGKGRWEYKLGESIQGTANRVDLAGGAKGIIAISQSDGAVHCVDVAAGKFLWKTEPQDRCDGSAGVGSGRIVMGSCASALHVFSVEKAAKLTDVELGSDGQVAGGVAMSGSLAFAGTRGGKLVAVDVVAGKVAWTNGDSKSEAFVTPAANDRWVVYGTDDGNVYGLRRATGAKLWSFDTGGNPSSPVIAGNRVVVSSGGTLFLLELETGRKVGSVKVSDEITSPAVVGGRILVGAGDGTVSAWGGR